MMRTTFRLVLGLLAVTSVAQQPAVAPKPIPMPAERAADSYAIYSQLLPSNAIGWSEASRTVWLVEDSTVTRFEDPRKAIEAPNERDADLEALFEDYDQHQAESIELSADGFHTDLPVRLADEAAQKRFVSSSGGHVYRKEDLGRYDLHEFDGMAGMHRFSEIYFNPSHTLAMVYFGIYCGSSCGRWSWVVLEHRDGRWVRLPWVYSAGGS